MNAKGRAGSPSRPEFQLSSAVGPASPARAESGLHLSIFSIALILALASGCAYFRSTPPPSEPSSAASAPPAAAPATTGPLSPSPRLIVGRVLSVDREQRLATIDLQSDAPAAALEPGTELIARDYNSLAQTALLRASRYVRGRTLGAMIESGQPSVGDEVVWLAP